MRVHVEPSQKKESLSVGVGLLILDGEFITAFNMRKQKQTNKKKNLVKTTVSNIKRGGEDIKCTTIKHELNCFELR